MSTARDILVNAVDTRTISPDLFRLVQGLPTPMSPWSTNDTTAAYAGLRLQAENAFRLWFEDDSVEHVAAVVLALEHLMNVLDSMTHGMRDFLSRIDN